jgi:hypothetical protein
MKKNKPGGRTRRENDANKKASRLGGYGEVRHLKRQQ